MGNCAKKQLPQLDKDFVILAKKGDINAMYKLGNYYYENKDYVNMKKYYLMAIDKGNTTFINESLLGESMLPVIRGPELKLIKKNLG